MKYYKIYCKYEVKDNPNIMGNYIKFDKVEKLPQIEDILLEVHNKQKPYDIIITETHYEEITEEQFDKSNKGVLDITERLKQNNR